MKSPGLHPLPFSHSYHRTNNGGQATILDPSDAVARQTARIVRPSESAHLMHGDAVYYTSGAGRWFASVLEKVALVLALALAPTMSIRSTHDKSHPGFNARRNAHLGNRAELETALREPMPETGNDPEQVMARLREHVWGKIMFSSSPRFFAFVPQSEQFCSAQWQTP